MREVQSNQGLPQEVRKILKKQPKLTPTEARKRTNKTQNLNRKEENNKDQSRGK